MIAVGNGESVGCAANFFAAPSSADLLSFLGWVYYTRLEKLRPIYDSGVGYKTISRVIGFMVLCYRVQTLLFKNSITSNCYTTFLMVLHEEIPSC